MTAIRTTLTAIVNNPYLVGAFVVALAAGAGWMSSGTIHVLSFVLISIIFALSINLLTGLAGQISLGHAGLFGMGAYVTGILAKTYGLPILLAIPFGALAAALVGYLLSFPAGRVRDVYLAMMTLGFGMIFFEIVREWNSVTGGMMGLSGVPSPTLRTLKILGYRIDEVWFFRGILLVTVLTLWIMRNVTQSRIGRAFFAIHHSEIAAGSLGISRAGTKQFAYVLSGLLAGLSGGIYAHLVGYLGPDSFTLNRSIEVLVIAIVGGLGSIAGQVLSATLFTFLPETLQVFSEYQFIVYGIILTFSLIVLPQGIAGLLLLPPRFIQAGSLARLRAGTGSKTMTASSQMGGLLEVDGLTKRFGGLTALNNVTLNLKPGHITALVGPNGSGKSTLVNVISGIYPPTEGKVLFKGNDITGLPDHKIARTGIVRTFQDPRLVPNFTVRENLLLGAHRLMTHSGFASALALPLATREEAAYLARIDRIMELTELTPTADQTVDSLPYGYRRLAEVARALVASPSAILLDEPAAGLSEIEMEHLSRIIRRMKEMGLTIMLIDHHMDFLAELVDDVVVLDSGKVIYRGTIDGMRADRTVINAYLGEEEAVHA
ncbi:branched-chain amino acid ABC transporter ATP-binding protein/permease [Bradyrhizobium sp. LHD-71]|uniref:branched-chain amino acid ABC transporter ATP-binding protein/permease n=1 Tax=Bradyrhizobium sp. LHD-71 TaxID=3072141 RepID=UPI00281042D8|nr:branched-chain amino acid ABC transporter ATP-binding protein/permease [Bradyrhizobium sp. LHD-71]MDQ8727189.1 branched-chain amino acid ABC transporter ATP-binding protein/permease [Bradyrhizobium sp. LHD-71]